MRVVTYIVLTSDEVERLIPYKLVMETLSGSMWDTRKREQQMRNCFSEEEIEEIEKMHRLARLWYIREGIPAEVSMPADTLCLWWRLAKFCLEL